MAIPVGSWLFHPERMIAINQHNGTKAVFYHNGKHWIGQCINCPTKLMFDELINWFAKWITDKE